MACFTVSHTTIELTVGRFPQRVLGDTQTDRSGRDVADSAVDLGLKTVTVGAELVQLGLDLDG